MSTMATGKSQTESEKEGYIPFLVEIMTRVEASNPANRHDRPNAEEDTQASAKEDSWKATIQRRAEARVVNSEKETLARVQRTWQELTCYIAREGLGLGDLSVEEENARWSAWLAILVGLCVHNNQLFR